jgi:dCTP deaminase
MAFWSSQRIETEHKKVPLVDPFDVGRIRHGAYELALSREVLTTPDASTGNSSPSDKALKIPPGQFALLYTEERVTIAKDTIGFISMKGSVKFKGLINISGFQVDPGFVGRLKFSVYNAGSVHVHLNYGEPCFLIWFADLDAATRDPYNGEHKNQKGLTPEDRDRMSRPSLSPAALANRIDELEEKRLDKLEHRFNVAIWVAGAILAGVIFPLYVALLQPIFSKWSDASPTKPSSASISTSLSQTKAVAVPMVTNTNIPAATSAIPLATNTNIGPRSLGRP